ncbi:MAG: signal recognition particle-docking protein FtsY [Acidimicrobiales bacterium]
MEIVILIILIAIVLVAGGIVAFTHSRRPGDEVPPASTGTLVEERPPEVAEAPVVVAPPATFRDRLSKARGALSGYFTSILSRGVDAQTWEELEELLIKADVGVPVTMSVLEELRTEVEADGVTDPEEVLTRLKTKLKEQLGGFDLGLAVNGDPAVWLFVGVNGVGKTTTIGKLAKREVDSGASVVLAAGDTFRAAAAEQLEMWADRSGAAIVRADEGADPSSVIFDGIEHASATDVDLVMADTAGRLHTKTNLMEELRKVRRVAEKGAGSVTEVLLVIDATTGQNGLTQAQQFTEAVEVTGVVLTKLDGSARGGIVIAIQADLDIPVKLVGLGEGPDDLVQFDADEFVEALFAA